MSNNTFVPSGRFLTSSSPTRPLTIRIPAAPAHSEPLHPPATNPPAPNLQAPNPPASTSTSTPTTSPFKIKLKLSPPKKPDPPKAPEKAPWPPVSEVQDRISKNPQLVIQNARLMVEDIRANGAAATLARPAMASTCMPSTNYESAHRFLLHKGALFPNEPMLHPKSRKPHLSKKRTSNDDGADVDVDVGASSDTSDAPASASPFRVRERPRKRARHGAPPERVTRDEAWRWAAVIGRIVKGKARLTPELIGEVNAALDAMEARKNDFTNEVLQEGVLDIVRLLSELQDNVYSLDGLRARARALVTAWSWIMTR